MKTTLATITVLATLASAPAIGADSPDFPGAPEFSDLDANADLYIDKQEFEQFKKRMRDARRERFEDSRRDGNKGSGDRIASLYSDADADGDGLLNESEFASLQESMQAMREKMRERLAERRFKN